MTPEFSRRLALVVHSPFFLERGAKFKDDFVDRVVKSQDFEALSPDDKKIVLMAEESMQSIKE